MSSLGANDIALAVVVVIFSVLAAWDAGYFHKGRHRGVYEEKPEWKPNCGFTFDGENIIWEGRVIIPDWKDPAFAVFTPAGGITSIPVPPVENAAVVLTPGDFATLAAIEDDYGRFGDVDIDSADQAPVCPFLPDGTFGGDGWQPIGTLATDE